MPDYTTKHSTAHIPSCRVVLGVDGLDGYRIDVVQHTEFVQDNGTDEMPSLVEIRIYNPEHNSDPLITMIDRCVCNYGPKPKTAEKKHDDC